MRLYVNSNNEKIYLDIFALSRNELASILGSAWFSIDGKQFHVHQVKAESSKNSTLTGAAVGGAIGLIGGPVGILLGSSIGGLIGSSDDNEDFSKVKHFNQSSL